MRSPRTFCDNSTIGEDRQCGPEVLSRRPVSAACRSRNQSDSSSSAWPSSAEFWARIEKWPGYSTRCCSARSRRSRRAGARAAAGVDLTLCRGAQRAAGRAAVMKPQAPRKTVAAHRRVLDVSIDKHVRNAPQTETRRRSRKRAIGISAADRRCARSLT